MPVPGSELPQAEEPGLFTKPGVVSERGWFRPRIRHLALRALGPRLSITLDPTAVSSSCSQRLNFLDTMLFPATSSVL